MFFFGKETGTGDRSRHKWLRKRAGIFTNWINFKVERYCFFQRAVFKSIYFAHKQVAITNQSVDNYLALYFWASNYEIKSSLLLKHPLWPPPGWIKSFECRRHSSLERTLKIVQHSEVQIHCEFSQGVMKGCQTLFPKQFKIMNWCHYFTVDFSSRSMKK